MTTSIEGSAQTKPPTRDEIPAAEPAATQETRPQRITAPHCQKTVLLKAFMVSKISLFPVLTAKIRMHSNKLGQNEQLNQSIIIRLNEGFVPINTALFIT